jgi:hypothetical protein
MRLNSILFRPYFVNSSIFKYRGQDRKIDKKSKNLIGLVNDHHVIPKSLHKHRALTRVDYQIHQGYNLMIMPNQHGVIQKLNLHPNTLYNSYVKNNLDALNNLKSNDELAYYIWLFVDYLKKMSKRNGDLPWH